jgi:hypothetical protein
MVAPAPVFCRRHHQPRKLPLARIRPGRPAPAMGLRTGTGHKRQIHYTLTLARPGSYFPKCNFRKTGERHRCGPPFPSRRVLDFLHAQPSQADVRRSPLSNQLSSSLINGAADIRGLFFPLEPPPFPTESFLRVPETPPFSCLAGFSCGTLMLEIAITLIGGFALGYGVREWAFRRDYSQQSVKRSSSGMAGECTPKRFGLRACTHKSRLFGKGFRPIAS